jgi:hypothetical protein
MTRGTKSLLFGAHAFWLHPFFVYAAWVKLYGWTLDPRILVACIVHDWGYAGCEAMDDANGKQHPRLGAKIMHFLFDWHDEVQIHHDPWVSYARWGRSTKWHDFCLYHSRSMARLEGKMPSKLCAADKLAPCLMPAWLYIPMAKLSGEIWEYMEEGQKVDMGEHVDWLTYLFMTSDVPGHWFRGLQRYMASWVKSYMEKETA